jgi:hypothetical protein
VADYNGDGAVDLLVGDFSSARRPKRTLTAEETNRRDELRARSAEVEKALVALPEQSGGKPDSESQEARKLQDELEAIHTELSPYEHTPEYHGWVWLYLRKAPPDAGKLAAKKLRAF